jgi:hypothetical protein
MDRWGSSSFWALKNYYVQHPTISMQVRVWKFSLTITNIPPFNINRLSMWSLITSLSPFVRHFSSSAKEGKRLRRVSTSFQEDSARDNPSQWTKTRCWLLTDRESRITLGRGWISPCVRIGKEGSIGTVVPWKGLRQETWKTGCSLEEEGRSNY